MYPMASKCCLIVAVTLVGHAFGQAVITSGPPLQEGAAVGLPSVTAVAPPPANATAVATPPANATASCPCTSLGISGGVYVDGRVGCAQHLADSGDNTYFCYVTDPTSCAPGTTNSSARYEGAAFRQCDPAIDITPEEARQQLTIDDVIAGVPQLSVFAQALAALNASSLAQQLNATDANLTVFAPTNSAFDDLFAVEGLQGPEDLASYPELLPLLLLHVAKGNLSADSFGDSQWHVSLPSLSPSLFSNITAKLVVNSFVTVAGPYGWPIPVPVKTLMLTNDVYDQQDGAGVSSGAYVLQSFETSNGVVHILDSVLAPLGDVVSSLDGIDAFSTFSKALNVTGLDAELGGGLASCPSPINATCNVTDLTVWAPTNDAFDALAQQMNTTVDELLQVPELADILRLHISPDSQLPGGGLALPDTDTNATVTIPTLLAGSNLTFTNDTRVVPLISSPFGTLYAPVQTFELSTAGGDTAQVDLGNRIKAYNGMIVPIDTVLQPNKVVNTTEMNPPKGNAAATAAGGKPGMARAGTVQPAVNAANGPLY